MNEAALARELPYWDILDDVVVLADGTLVAGFNIKGVAVETWDADRINQLALDARTWLNSLPDGIEVSISYELDTGDTPAIDEHAGHGSADPISETLCEWRVRKIRAAARSGSVLQVNGSMAIYARPETRAAGSIHGRVKRLFSSPKAFSAERLGDLRRRIGEFRQTSSAIAAGLEATGVQTRSMAGSDVVAQAYTYLNPTRSKDHPLAAIQSGYRAQEFLPEEVAIEHGLAAVSLRDQISLSDVVSGYDRLFVDGQWHRVITLKALPEVTYAAMMSRLESIGMSSLTCLHIKVPRQSDELSRLQARRRMAHSLSLSSNGRATDLESEAKLQATEELLRDLLGSAQKIFYGQLAVIVRDKTQEGLEQKTKAVLAKLREMSGAEGLVEQAAGFQVWKSLLPLGLMSMIRPRRMKTDNLADLLPIYRGYEGDPGMQAICLFENRSRSLVRYDPFYGGLPNYNGLVTGSSGSGKSFLANLVLLQSMARRPKVYVIDVGGSYKKLAEYFGGQYIALAPPDDGASLVQAINPFDLPKGESSPSPRKLKGLVAILETILAADGGSRLGKLDRSMLEERLLEIYSDAEAPTLSRLATSLAESDAQTLRDFARMLFPWTGSRPYGRLLDGLGTLAIDGDFVVFDLKGLSSYPDLQAVMLLIVTDFILGQVEDGSDRPKQIIMDEAWELLKSSGASSFMEYCVRTLRKMGAGITFITQGLDEIVQSPIGGAILSNTATKFLLRQRGDIEPVRKILRLNDEEMNLIASLRQVKGSYSEAFMIAGDDRSVIRASPTPLEYWLASSDARDNAAISALRQEYPDKTLREVLEILAERHPFGMAGRSN